MTTEQTAFCALYAGTIHRLMADMMNRQKWPECAIANRTTGEATAISNAICCVIQARDWLALALEPSTPDNPLSALESI